MYLGSRKIRTAGRTSGSVEITLPPQLHILMGLECHLSVRDGLRPEIVLQADFSAAQALFRTLWQLLQLGMGGIGDIGDFSMADFSIALFPSQHGQERPPLAYTDALMVLNHRHESDEIPREAGEDTSCAASEALVRLLTFLAVAAAYRLGLEDSLALAFGDATAYRITGKSVGPGTDFERGMAHRAFWGDGHMLVSIGDPFDDNTWQQARQDLRQVYDQFSLWHKNPGVYGAARENWYRALMMEIATPMGESPGREIYDYDQRSR